MPRLFLIEDEYRAAMLDAEIAWLKSVATDLDTGELTWDWDLIERTLKQFG